MTQVEKLMLHAANLLVGGTGVVYAFMRYAMTPADEWSIVNHPWQPHVQHLHIVFAPLLVFIAGVVWKGHVAERLQNERKSLWRSGLSLLAWLAPMVISGYLIQVSVQPSWRSVWVGVHVVTSLLWLSSSVLHALPRRARQTDDLVGPSAAFFPTPDEFVGLAPTPTILQPRQAEAQDPEEGAHGDRSEPGLAARESSAG